MAHGYKIFVIVAKGIYIKIDEDEDNIKVAVEQESVQAMLQISHFIAGILIVIIIWWSSFGLFSLIVLSFR